MGDGGKLLTPDSGGEDGSEESKRPGLSISELVSELLYGGKLLADIAGLDDRQLHQILCRRRDDSGDLVRDNGLPPWVHVDAKGQRIIKNPVPFSEMYATVKKAQGVDRDQAKEAWDRYLEDNPKLALAVRRREAVQARVEGRGSGERVRQPVRR